MADGVTSESVTVTFRGDPALAPAFADLIRDEGLSVGFTGSLVPRGLNDEAMIVAELVVGGLTLDAVHIGIAKARDQFARLFRNSKAEVSIVDSEVGNQPHQPGG
jgi:hypothetical protein